MGDARRIVGDCAVTPASRLPTPEPESCPGAQFAGVEDHIEVGAPQLLQPGIAEHPVSEDILKGNGGTSPATEGRLQLFRSRDRARSAHTKGARNGPDREPSQIGCSCG